MIETAVRPVPVPHSFNLFPRVTALTNLIPKDGFLQRWLDKELIKASWKCGKLSSRILNYELDLVYEERRQATALPADLGTLVHALIAGETNSDSNQASIPGEPLQPTITQVPTGTVLPPQLLRSLPHGSTDLSYIASAWTDFMQSYGHAWTPVLVEQRLAGRIDLPITGVSTIFTGSPDLVCYDHNGKLAVVDWKTSRAVYPQYAVQLGIYARLLQAHNYPVEAAYVVRLDKKKPGKSQVVETSLESGKLLEPLLETHFGPHMGLILEDDIC